MAIEGLDAAVLIETAGFVPQAELPRAQGAEAEPTLDAALAEAGLNDRRVERRETLLDRLEMLKADLWVSPAFQIRRAMPHESVAMTPLRDLDDAEFALIAGGSGSDMNGDGDIVVTGHRYWDWNFPENDPGEEYPDGTGGDDSDPEEPNCSNSQPIKLVHGEPADNAKYYVPEGVGKAYLNAAINHIVSIYDNNVLNFFDVRSELLQMYTDPNHSFFIDFKDWGTPNGPPGTSSGGVITYHSDVSNQDVTVNAFEPFGNYFFGFLLTFAGIPPEEIYAIAAWMQEGGSGFADDPLDSPHVQKGIVDAARYLSTPEAERQSLVGVEPDCSSDGS